MSDESRIQWTDATWNPTTGCSKVSQGCKHCYALRDWARLSRNPNTVYYGREFTDVQLHPERLEQPLRWTKPRRVFVNSMSDLFHEDVPFEFIASVFAVMSVTTRHTYQVLTKRPKRMQKFFSWVLRAQDENGRWHRVDPSDFEAGDRISAAWPKGVPWKGYDNCGPAFPPENVWLGVSVEDQATADERVPLLLKTPAAVRFVSAEPLMGPVDLYGGDPDPRLDGVVAGDGLSLGQYWKADGSGPYPGVDWVIVGGESGPRARPCDVTWIRSIVDQCAAASCPVFVKQIGKEPRNWCVGNAMGEDNPLDEFDCDAWEASEGPACPGRCLYIRSKKGDNMEEWPVDVRVREFPQ